jgi:hypothetical protein
MSPASQAKCCSQGKYPTVEHHQYKGVRTPARAGNAEGVRLFFRTPSIRALYQFPVQLEVISLPLNSQKGMLKILAIFQGDVTDGGPAYLVAPLLGPQCQQVLEREQFSLRTHAHTRRASHALSRGQAQNTWRLCCGTLDAKFLLFGKRTPQNFALLDTTTPTICQQQQCRHSSYR